MRPAAQGSSPQIARASAVLPEAFAPRIAHCWPSRICQQVSWRMCRSPIRTVIRSRSIKIRSEDTANDLPPPAMRTVIIQQSTLVRQSPFGCCWSPTLLILGLLQDDSTAKWGNLDNCIQHVFSLYFTFLTIFKILNVIWLIIMETFIVTVFSSCLNVFSYF